MKRIIIKPIISEKSELQSEQANQYSFVVNKSANKIEIKNAVQNQFSVAVESVKTINMPAKRKSRNTKSGVIKGTVSSYKKAIVRLSEGDQIDFFGEVE